MKTGSPQSANFSPMTRCKTQADACARGVCLGVFVAKLSIPIRIVTIYFDECFCCSCRCWYLTMARVIRASAPSTNNVIENQVINLIFIAKIVFISVYSNNIFHLFNRSAITLCKYSFKSPILILSSISLTKAWINKAFALPSSIPLERR